ncbi:MAG: hypothetical protein J6T47_10490, partial [Lachnospiraceae bacterium]|nr:hypothetical protein [Lachnospiraceae bacterium]
MRRNMGKAGAIALSAAMTLSCLAGCARTEQDPTTAENTQGTIEETTVAPETTAEPETATEAPKPENEAQKAFSEFEQDMIEYIIDGRYYSAERYFKNPEEYGLTSDRLTDYSITSYKDPEGTVKQKAERAKALLEKSDLIDRSELNDQQKLAYEKFRYYLETNLRKKDVPLLTSDHMVSRLNIDLFYFPFDDENDLIGYQKILEAVPGVLTDEIGFIKYQKEKLGYELSDAKIDELIDSAQDLANAEDSPLLDIFDEKVNAMDLSADQKAEYIRKNREYVTGPLAEAML